ncbi:EAL domain-containing protein [Qipengyuania sediminis]|uniref:EAL domain-containing protein n=1 Tax=Qipengyuania sediminis TaxID=1532023 RepID=UPI0010598A19|nr:EAL domain-containing protein [Qipengyuania sediminis]
MSAAPPEACWSSGLAAATFEFRNFGAIRELVGPGGVHDLLSAAAARIADTLPGCEIAAIERASVAVRFPMQTPGTVEAMLCAAGMALLEPMHSGAIPFRLSAHVGWAAPQQGLAQADLAERAAMAAWTAKVSGLPLRAYDTTQAGAAKVPDAELLRDLPAALADGETRLAYQPKVNARSGLPQSLEALLRWTRADGRRVPIAHLVALTEHTGYIRDLTEWALGQALTDGAELAAAGFALPVHVNVSAPLLADDGFVADTLARLASAKRGAGAIGLELTETAAIEDQGQVRRNLVRLAEAGVHVAIDDYGSGLSSLAYIKGLPVRELKIDRLFISELTRCNRDPLIVRSTIDLAHAMEMEVTAEGVEDPVAAALLGVMGCDLLQGYQICPPLPVDQLIAFLRAEVMSPAGSPAALLRRLNAG